MRLKGLTRAVQGFTIWELLAVGLAMIGVVSLLMPQLASDKAPARRVQCISNLKQTVLAFRLFATDHEEQFPMRVSLKQGGSAEFVYSAEVFRHFLAVSNELNSPKVFTCPSDLEAHRVASWTNFSNRNLSYFLNIDGTQQVRQMIMSGDRNITGGTLSNDYLMVFSDGIGAGFSPDVHQAQGNLAFGDGTAKQVRARSFRAALDSANAYPARFAIPRVFNEKDSNGGLQRRTSRP